MNSSVFWRLMGAIAVILPLFSCATPTQPTGGPRDETPPLVVETSPANGSVNFEGETISFSFNKYVNRESFEQAFRIDPVAGIRYEVDWSGKTVRVEFEEALPDSTTLLFTIGTEFSDTNRNRLSQPFVLALSTGDVIDEGRIDARLLDGKTGRGRPDAFVFLYREPVDLETPASYVAQSDTAGNISFSYLAEGRYKAFYVDDRNQNRRWEPERETARPFYKEFVEVSQNDTAELGRLYLSEPDTLRPRLEGIGLFSTRRLRLRFSREMDIGPEATINIQDSLGQTVTQAVPLYVDPDEASIIFAEALENLEENSRYSLDLQGLNDIHGNAAKPNDQTFSGTAQPDTTQMRLIRHLTEDGVRQDQPFIFEFSSLLNNSAIVDSLEIIEDEVIYEAWEPLETEQNLLYIFPPPPGKWREGSDYTVRLYDESAGSYENIETQFFPDKEAGSLRIIVADQNNGSSPANADSGAVRHHITLLDEREEVVFETQLAPGENAHAEGLRPGKYTLRAYQDEDGNERWFRGEVLPWQAPEPYFIARDIEVFPRMEGEYELIYEFGSKPE
ncbi:MAG: Ig-like domain-containing protein [Cyclonatronaceae bacterium]